MKKTKRGWTEAEFLSCKHETEQLLLEGHSITAIHTALHDAGKIKMSFIQFYRLVRYYKLSTPPLDKLVLDKDREIDDLKNQDRSEEE